MSTASLVIGIDPDVDKSGFAIWDKASRKFVDLEAHEFYDLLDRLSELKATIDHVRVEAGWLNKKSNFHPMQGAFRRERAAKNVGENQQIGKLIARYCERQNIQFQLVKPLRKEKGKNGLPEKMGAEQFNRLTGWRGQSNQEKRDAGLLVFGY